MIVGCCKNRYSSSKQIPRRLFFFPRYNSYTLTINLNHPSSALNELSMWAIIFNRRKNFFPRQRTIKYIYHYRLIQSPPMCSIKEKNSLLVSSYETCLILYVYTMERYLDTFIKIYRII